METTRQRLAALTLCLLALASVTVATAPAAAQTGTGNDDGASNATELGASFEYDSVDGCNPHVEGEWNSLTLTADAEAYAVTVRANGLDGEELVNIFDDGLDAAEPDISAVERVDDETVRLRVRSRNATLPANFWNVDTGDYEFVFEAGENATATATVTKAEVSCVRAEFLRGGSYESGRSGVVMIPIWLDETDEARVLITGSDLSLSADIVDGNDDGIVTLDLNTHLVGRDAPDDGHGRSYWTRQGLTVRGSADSIDDIALDDVPGGDDPLPTGEYELAVDRERIDYTLATGSLSITDTAIADFESWTGPVDTLTNATASDFRRAIENGTLADNQTVSNGSALVYEIESASVFGPLEAAASQYGGSDRYAKAFFDIAADPDLSAVPGNPVTFDTTADSGVRIDLRDTFQQDGLVVAPDHDNDTLYVGLRTDRLAVTNGTAIGSGQEFDASLVVDNEISQQPVTFRGVNATLVLPSTPQTPVTPNLDDAGTEQDLSPTSDTRRSTTVGLATVETPAPTATDSTGKSPDPTTTADGPGFGVAAVVLAVLALCAFAVRRRE